MTKTTSGPIEVGPHGRAPIAVALDAQDLAQAVHWAAAVAPSVAALKVGLQSYLRDGAAGVEAVLAAAVERVDDAPALFLDLKLHDIPNTVAGAAQSVAHLAPAILTVHALGGPDMVSAAAQELPDTRIAAVTILTSMDAAALAATGIAGTPRDAVRRLAAMAVAAGARALVCSPLEVADVRAEVGSDVVLITPGVRPAEASVGDQKRVATPQAALAAGADLLVIGRPITAAADPGAAAAAIAAGIT
ncbi:MAG: orotidine-5'-phosphate decarboxylase [Candidatus Nanopelagicales bacterium]